MSAQHRKPFVAFVLLAFVAFGLVGLQHADAENGRLLAAPLGAAAHVRGMLEVDDEDAQAEAADRVAALGPAFVATLSGNARTVTVLRRAAASTSTTGSDSAPEGTFGAAEPVPVTTRATTATGRRATTRPAGAAGAAAPTQDRQSDKAPKAARGRDKQVRRTQAARAHRTFRASGGARVDVGRFLTTEHNSRRAHVRSDRPGMRHGHKAHRAKNGKAHGRAVRGKHR